MLPPDVTIRPEGPADRDAIAAVHRAAFGDEGATIVALVDELRALLTPACGLSLVAEAGGAIVGHVMCSPSLLDAPRRLVTVPVLSPLGVLPGWQGRGIGAALVGACPASLAAQGAPLLFLEGSPRYYGRLGFVAGAPLGFRKPSLRIPDAAFQVMVLPAHEPWMTGTLVYAETFWRHDAVGLRDPDA